jgi:hypothetical protein
LINVQTIEDMGTPKFIATSNQDASNAQTNATGKKDPVMSNVSCHGNHSGTGLENREYGHEDPMR